MEPHIFDSFPEPVFLTGPEGRIRYRNPAARRLEPSWAEGTAVPPALDLTPDEDGVFSCTLGGRDFQAASTPVPEGSLLVLRPAPSPAGQAFDLMYLAAHLRQHLQSISLAAQMLGKDAPGQGEDHERHLAILQQSLFRLLRLVRHLETAGGVEAGRGRPFEHVLTDLAALCRDVAYGTAALAEQAGTDFQDSIPGGILTISGERELLEQMLLELISNALKAAGPGGQAGIKLASTGRRALITVWDSGPGMDEEDLAALMEGRSLDRPPKPGAGLGLGLALARQIASLHGGAILLESQPGQGLRATVSLPVRRTPKGTLNSPVKEPEGGYPALLTGLADALPWQSFLEEL